jgi:D-lactate dehydrogenase (cytochrome)
MQFAPDPSSQRASTIGGNLATNAGGPHCLKYGVTTNHILAVQLACPDGSLIWTSDGLPDPVGYDLTGLVVGSEGTFGVVTQVLVRLTPLPEAVRVVLALFPNVVAAAAAVSRVIAAGSLPTSLEVMDHNAIRAVNSAYKLGLPEADGTTLLIIEVDGVADGLDDLLEEILACCRAEGAFDLRPARTAAEQAQVWAARKSVAGAIGRLAPAYYLVDTVVPRTRLPLMLEHVERLRHEHGMEVCNVFHAGDGNLHPLVLYDPRDAEQRRKAHAIAHGVLELSIAQGGVISGEHGIGVEKQNYLPLLFSPAELQLHATIHQIFNPQASFNPAKIFPLDTSPAALAALRHARICTAPPPAAVAPATPAVLQYEPDDLTIGVSASMRLAELQTLLAKHQQMLPLDVADPHQSIGTLVAQAAAGPRRLGYGLLRDWVLALTVREPDGTEVRLGAQVVKNVTGYDLVKLYVGSQGRLGTITAVSLKVFPRPQHDASFLIGCSDSAQALRLLDALAATRLQPTAVEYLDAALAPAQLASVACGILVRAEGHPAAVERHQRELTALAQHAHAAAPITCTAEQATALWQAVITHTAAPLPPATLLLHIAHQPATLGHLLTLSSQLAHTHHVHIQRSAHALSGVLYLRATGSADALQSFTTALADACPTARLRMILGDQTISLRTNPHPATELMDALNTAIDPRGHIVGELRRYSSAHDFSR